MDTDELVALAIAGIAVWMLLSSRKAVAATMPTVAGPNGDTSPGFVTELQNAALPGQPAYSWRYFSDGTVIDPNGAYYRQGVKLWG